MMAPDRLRSLLASMEDALADTRRNLALAERRLNKRADVETIRLRPKSRHDHRSMSRWTGADEAEYRRVLDRFLVLRGRISTGSGERSTGRRRRSWRCAGNTG